ncbi:Era-like GTP-binding protein [Pseudanabaena sp. PCC 6802]|uniref:Era-like GTP-binding protein n=1 Tax=Pseudanabaena sp. PCC 6802 TaxID=118173 RepID=UPI0003485664|nr:Era-like GTP-binding protein [Pseudanabaena sp. PCC 6802]
MSDLRSDPSLKDRLPTQPTPDFLNLARDRIAKYLDRYAGDLDSSEIEKLKELELKLAEHQVEIAVFGLVSRGKTAVINALLGRKVGITGATHGTTQTPTGVQFDLSRSSNNTEQLPIDAPAPARKVQLKLIDTPGLDEIDGEDKGEMAKAIAKQADLILFVVAGDMTRLELETLSELRSASKPILLVFNKVDLYPESDRAAIHAALQNKQLQHLISPDEIILTAAEPLPTKVRVQYAGMHGSQNPASIAETWEPQPPQIQALKQKILDLLNQEGKALLAIDALRTLAQIQDTASDRRIQKLPRLRSVASLVFAIKAIASILSPSFWLDAIISAGIDLPVALVWTRSGQALPGASLPLWLGAILLNAAVTSAWGLEAQITQIGWLGITTPFLLQSLQAAMHRHSGWGKTGARTLAQEILQQVPTNSILSRISPELEPASIARVMGN